MRVITLITFRSNSVIAGWEIPVSQRLSIIVVLVALVFSRQPDARLMAASSAKSLKGRPNIIFFLVDDMGWQETSVPFHHEVTALNRRYRTPAMERMAREGIKFTNAYASAVCSPSRISALSGMNAARHGVTNWTLRKGVSPDDENQTVEPPRWNLNGATTVAGIDRTVRITPLPEILRAAGYRTIHVGKAHFGAAGTPGADPLHFGFDVNIAGHAAGAPGSYWGEKNFAGADPIWDVPGLAAWHGQPINLTEVLTREAIGEVERSVSKQQPFYLYLSHYAVHAPWEEDRRFYQKYIDEGLTRPEAIRASMIESMDRSLGDLMESLDRLGVADNTLLLFVSDNGAPHAVPLNLPLRGQKLAPYEGGIRVPMMARWPVVTQGSSISRTPVIIEDLFPTILDAAAVNWRKKTIQTVDGVSFMPVLAGQAGQAGQEKMLPDRSLNRPLIFHFPHQYYGQGPFSAIRLGPWKLIHHHAEGKMELYNIDRDISETNDLSLKERAVTIRLARILAARLRAEKAMMPIVRKTGRPVTITPQR